MRTRHRPMFLARALRSVLGQTCSNWILCVINDGGDPDQVEQVLTAYRPAFGERLKVVHNVEWRGMEAASNLSLSMAEGEYVVIHDDDDSWLPRFLEHAIACIEQSGAMGVVTRSTLLHEVVGPHGPETVDEQAFMPELTEITHARLLEGNCYPPIAFLYRRTALETLGGYREDLPVLGDWEFNLRFAKTFSVQLCVNTLARWHVRPQRENWPNSNQASRPIALRQIRKQHGNGKDITDGDRCREMGPVRVWRIPGQIAPVAATAEQEINADEFIGTETRESGWYSTSDAPSCRYDLSNVGPGIYLLTFNVGGLNYMEHPGVTFVPDGRAGDEGTISCQPTHEGNCALLVQILNPISGVSISPFRHRGPYTLGPLTLRPLPWSHKITNATIHKPPRHHKPDFLCIGAQRSGTTWLYRQLSKHPRVWMPPSKEIHYFDEIHDLETGRWPAFRRKFLTDVLFNPHSEKIDFDRLLWALDYGNGPDETDHWYLRQFGAAPANRITGDITPAYALLPDAGVAYVHALLPQAKIIMIVRNPIDRSISGAIHELVHSQGRRSIGERDILTELDSTRNILRSDYKATIERWTRHYGHEQLGVFFYDDLVTNPVDFLERVGCFLGVAMNSQDVADIRTIENASPRLTGDQNVWAVLKKREAKKWLDQLEWLADRYGQIPKTWLHAARKLAAS